MNLALAIRHLFPDADPMRDFRVEDNGSGQFLAVWNLEAPQPTPQQLDTAWVEVQAQQAGAAQLFAARLAMADAFHALPVEIRADHADDYAAIEASIIRGDVAAAKKRVETMPLLPEREALRAQFLAFFPS